MYNSCTPPYTLEITFESSAWLVKIRFLRLNVLFLYLFHRFSNESVLCRYLQYRHLHSEVGIVRVAENSPSPSTCATIFFFFTCFFFYPLLPHSTHSISAFLALLFFLASLASFSYQRFVPAGGTECSGSI